MECYASMPNDYGRGVLPDHDEEGSGNDSEDSTESGDYYDETAVEAVSLSLPSPKRPELGGSILSLSVSQIASKKEPDKICHESKTYKASPTTVWPPLLPRKVEASTAASSQASESEVKGSLKRQGSPLYDTNHLLPIKKARKEEHRFNDRTFWLENFMEIPGDINRAIVAQESVADIGSILVPVTADVEDFDAMWKDLEASNEKLVHNASTLYRKRGGKWRVTGRIRAQNLVDVQAKGMRLHFPQNLHMDRRK